MGNMLSLWTSFEWLKDHTGSWTRACCACSMTICINEIAMTICINEIGCQPRWSSRHVLCIHQFTRKCRFLFRKAHALLSHDVEMETSCVPCEFIQFPVSCHVQLWTEDGEFRFIWKWTVISIILLLLF